MPSVQLNYMNVSSMISLIYCSIFLSLKLYYKILCLIFYRLYLILSSSALYCDIDWVFFS